MSRTGQSGFFRFSRPQKRPGGQLIGSSALNDVIEHMDQRVANGGFLLDHLSQALDLRICQLSLSSGEDGDRLTAPTYKYNVSDPYEITIIWALDVAPIVGRANGSYNFADWGIWSGHYDPDNIGGSLLYAFEIPETQPACI